MQKKFLDVFVNVSIQIIPLIFYLMPTCSANVREVSRKEEKENIFSFKRFPINLLQFSKNYSLKRKVRNMAEDSEDTF